MKLNFPTRKIFMKNCRVMGYIELMVLFKNGKSFKFIVFSTPKKKKYFTGCIFHESNDQQEADKCDKIRHYALNVTTTLRQ